MQQTADESSTDYNGKGFISERSGTGSFTYQFTKAGTYYFSSGYLDDGEFLDMKGMVIVEPAASVVVNVDVKVNGKFWLSNVW